MINGRLEDLKIQQVNSASMAFDEKFKDKTTLECWLKIEDDSNLLDQYGEIKISP